MTSVATNENTPSTPLHDSQSQQDLLNEKSLFPEFTTAEAFLEPVLRLLISKCQDVLKNLQSFVKQLKTAYAADFNIQNLRVRKKKDELITEVLTFFCSQIITKRLEQLTDKNLTSILKYVNAELKKIKEETQKAPSAIKAKPLKPKLVEEICSGLKKLLEKKAKYPSTNTLQYPNDKKRPRENLILSSNSSSNNVQNPSPTGVSPQSTSQTENNGSMIPLNDSFEIKPAPPKKQRTEDTSSKLSNLLMTYYKEATMSSSVASDLLHTPNLSHLSSKEAALLIADISKKQNQVSAQMKNLLNERISIIEDLQKVTRLELKQIEEQLKQQHDQQQDQQQESQ